MSKDTKSEKQREREQREFDKLYTQYEEGIELAPGTFPISHFYAKRMAQVVFNDAMGTLRSKRTHIAPDLIDNTEVAYGVTIVKRKGRYFLDYECNAAINDLLEYWLNM